MGPNELRQKAKESVARAGAMIEAAEAENRNLTEPEQAQIDACYKEADGYEARAKRLEAQATREGGMAQLQRAPEQPANSTRDRVEVIGEQAFDSRGSFLLGVRALANANTCPQALQERMGNYQLELRAAAGMNESLGSEGGFLVMPEMTTEIKQRVFADSNIPGMCTRQGIGAGKNALSYPMIDESRRTDSYRQGGVLAYWTNEDGSMTASKTKIKEGRINLDKITALAYCTDELIEDATALEGWYSREVPKAISFKLTDALINGIGTSGPKGILESGALVTVSKETGQAAATVVAENIMSMYTRAIDPARCAWFINQAIWPQIFKLHLKIGTGGVPLFLPPGGMVSAPYGTLFGRPIYPVEQCAAPGTVGDIIFADWSDYLIIDKGGVKFDTSIHVYFDTAQTAFRWIYRVNGKPIDETTVTPFKGSDTIGSFIALAARA